MPGVHVRDIDSIDYDILEILSANGRITMTDLARRIGMSAPSVTDRVRRLEDSGIIKGFRADVDIESLGYGIGAYVQVRPVPGQLSNVAALLERLEGVIECHRVTGDDCFVARVQVRSVAELESLIDRMLPIASTRTSIIQSTTVSRRLPLISADAASE